MMFSKSFGYALRGVLYVALMEPERRNVQIEEIAATLHVPRHFMGKVLKKLVHHHILHSAKGPSGGFSVGTDTLSTSLLTIMEITDGEGYFKNCALRFHECNMDNPCPLHDKMDAVKKEFKNILAQTTVEDLLQNNHPDFIKSIATIGDFSVNLKTEK